MSAQSIYDTAPLGSLIRYSNREPRPPERFTRKLRTWNNENGLGRLVERYPGDDRTGYHSPAHFMLHLGNWGSQDVIVLTVRRAYSVESALQFEIVDLPKPGSVRILTSYDGRDELRHLAPDMAAAEDWMARNRYSGMRSEVVTDPDPVIPPSGVRRAA